MRLVAESVQTWRMLMLRLLRLRLLWLRVIPSQGRKVVGSKVPCLGRCYTALANYTRLNRRTGLRRIARRRRATVCVVRRRVGRWS